MDDDCINKITAAGQSQPDEDGKADNCSPFFDCGTCCIQAIDLITPVMLTHPDYTSYPTHGVYYLSALANYHAPFFQPPRVG
jgi:hypothetical protein